jgi:hypothetical protein
VTFLIFGKYLRYLKQIITCSLRQAKITNYEPIEKGPTSKICPPPPNSDRSTVPAKKLILFIQFSAALSLCLFLPKIARINWAAEHWLSHERNKP